MKFFSVFTAIALTLLGTVTVVVAQSSDQLIRDYRTVTQDSANLRDVVADITAANVLAQGSKVASGLQNIVDIVSDATKQLVVPKPKTFPDDVAEDVVDVLTDFVLVHQALLNTIIGKHGILAGTGPFGQAIACVLRTLEGVVDTFAFATIALIPTREGEGQDQKNSLDKTFANAINVYGTCFAGQVIRGAK